MKSGIRCALLLAVLSAGCGLRHTIDRDLLADITIENKLLLFDAENDVSIALDERDQLQRELIQNRMDIRDVDRQIEEVASDARRASAKKEEAKVQLAVMAREVFGLKIDYLDARADFLRKRQRVQDALITVAWARYELAKAKLVKKNNVRGASDLDLNDFEEQVTACIEAARAEKVKLAEAEKELEAVKKPWSEKREKLMAASGGGLGSPWAEETALWEKEQ